MGILVVICYFVIVLRIYIYINLFLKSNVELHNKALQSIALTASVFFDKNPTGRIINRFSKDVGVMDGPLQYYLFEVASTSLLIIGNLVVTIIIIPYNVIMIAIWCGILYSLTKYVSTGPLLSTINSALNGLPTLRCLNIQRKFKTDIKQFTLNHYRAYLTFHTLLRFNQHYADIGAALIVALNVIIIVGAKGFIDPSLAALSLASSAGLLGLTSI